MNAEVKLKQCFHHKFIERLILRVYNAPTCEALVLNKNRNHRDIHFEMHVLFKLLQNVLATHAQKTWLLN